MKMEAAGGGEFAEMIVQYRNHPSIILWGVRINESQDDDVFTGKQTGWHMNWTNAGNRRSADAKEKPSSGGCLYLQRFSARRQTPGCDRNEKSTSDTKKPYLISEYNGHMYPTKPFDYEEHRSEHAIRHANVLDAVAEQDIAGSFSWCMFDYNTHKDFGSGDRICYHGVMDMFRNPKLAAAVYASEQEDTPCSRTEFLDGYRRASGLQPRETGYFVPMRIVCGCTKTLN